MIDQITKTKSLVRMVNENADPELRLFVMPHRGRHFLGAYRPDREFYDMQLYFDDVLLLQQVLDTYFPEFLPDPNPPDAFDDVEGVELRPTYYKREQA